MRLSCSPLADQRVRQMLGNMARATNNEFCFCRWVQTTDKVDALIRRRKWSA